MYDRRHGHLFRHCEADRWMISRRDPSPPSVRKPGMNGCESIRKVVWWQRFVALRSRSTGWSSTSACRRKTCHPGGCPQKRADGSCDTGKHWRRANGGGRLLQIAGSHAPYGDWKTMTFIAALRHDRVDTPWLLAGPRSATSPPVGTAMYAVCSILKAQINDCTREAAPLFAAVISTKSEPTCAGCRGSTGVAVKVGCRRLRRPGGARSGKPIAWAGTYRP